MKIESICNKPIELLQSQNTSDSVEPTTAQSVTHDIWANTISTLKTQAMYSEHILDQLLSQTDLALDSYRNNYKSEAAKWVELIQKTLVSHLYVNESQLPYSYALKTKFLQLAQVCDEEFEQLLLTFLYIVESTRSSNPLHQHHLNIIEKTSSKKYHHITLLFYLHSKYKSSITTDAPSISTTNQEHIFPQSLPTQLDATLFQFNTCLSIVQPDFLNACKVNSLSLLGDQLQIYRECLTTQIQNHVAKKVSTPFDSSLFFPSFLNQFQYSKLLLEISRNFLQNQQKECAQLCFNILLSCKFTNLFDLYSLSQIIDATILKQCDYKTKVQLLTQLTMDQSCCPVLLQKGQLALKNKETLIDAQIYAEIVLKHNPTCPKALLLLIDVMTIFHKEDEVDLPIQTLAQLISPEIELLDDPLSIEQHLQLRAYVLKFLTTSSPSLRGALDFEQILHNPSLNKKFELKTYAQTYAARKFLTSVLQFPPTRYGYQAAYTRYLHKMTSVKTVPDSNIISLKNRLLIDNRPLQTLPTNTSPTPYDYILANTYLQIDDEKKREVIVQNAKAHIQDLFTHPKQKVIVQAVGNLFRQRKGCLIVSSSTSMTLPVFGEVTGFYNLHSSVFVSKLYRNSKNRPKSTLIHEFTHLFFNNVVECNSSPVAFGSVEENDMDVALLLDREHRERISIVGVSSNKRLAFKAFKKHLEDNQGYFLQPFNPHDPRGKHIWRAESIARLTECFGLPECALKFAAPHLLEFYKKRLLPLFEQYSEIPLKKIPSDILN